MNWRVQDYLQWQSAKAYIDTIVIPLIPMDWEDIEGVNDGEFLDKLCITLEQAYHGRIIISLPFTYFRESIESRQNRLDQIIEGHKQSGIEHIIPITCDSTWKEIEREILFIRPISMRGMTEEFVKEYIKIQLQFVEESIYAKWLAE